MINIMELKKVQEVWDKCNFTEEEKKLFPRPETEEDLKDFEKKLFTIQPYCTGSYILWLILSALFTGFGGWGGNINNLQDCLNKSSEEKIDKDNPES